MSLASYSEAYFEENTKVMSHLPHLGFSLLR